MKSQEIDDIRAAASSVEGATAVGENTAKRVGGVLVDIAEYLGDVEMGSDPRGGFLSVVYDGKEVLRAGKDGVMVAGNYTDESGITFQRMGRLVTFDLNKAEELGLLKDKGADYA